MRRFTCTCCGKPFSRGTSRIVKKLLFHFRAECWSKDRRGCEELAAKMAA